MSSSENESGDKDELKEVDNESSGTRVPTKSGSTFYEIKDGPKGRGLFASKEIPPGTLLHEAPCLRVVKEEYDNYMRRTLLEHYLFNADRGDKLLALGHGSLFNHSRRPNIDYRVDASNLCIRYFAGHKVIPANEELCIYYGANLWFDDASTGSQNDSGSESETGDDGVATFLTRLEL